MSEREDDSNSEDTGDVSSVCDVWVVQPDGSLRPMIHQYAGEPLWTEEEIAAGKNLDEDE